MRAELAELLARGQFECTKCEWGASRSRDFAAIQNRHKPLRMLEVTVGQIAKDIDLIIWREMGQSTCRWGLRHEVPSQKKSSTDFLESLMTEMRPCLTCLGDSSQSQSCRKTHKDKELPKLHSWKSEYY